MTELTLLKYRLHTKIKESDIVRIRKNRYQILY
jgi:hypothetical protein